jgi:phosphonate transport system substrate-binding protein
MNTVRRKFLALLAIPAALSAASALSAPAGAASSEAFTVGLIAAGTTEQVIASWKPLTDALARELQVPVKVIASRNYADISNALRDGSVQLAWINNKLAIELVETDQAQVFAQMVRLDGTRGYKSVLLARKDGAVRSVADLVARPGTLRFGSGDRKSTSGFLVPNYYVFAKNKIDPDRHFAQVTHANHLDNFLAVADGRIDVATNNTEEIPRYQAEYAERFAKVAVIWESPLIPNDPLLYRKDLPAATQQKIRKFILGYGRTAQEKAALVSINGLAGFKASSNYQLRPVVDLELFQALTRAMAGGASGEQFNGVVQQLTQRAARLDNALNATRLGNE